jgi:arylformamidase
MPRPRRIGFSGVFAARARAAPHPSDRLNRTRTIINSTMTLFDITLPMTRDLAPWPGDVPYDFRLGWKMAEGASVNVGALSTSVHSGTHADAPFHFLPHGATIEQLDPAIFVGPALVIDVTGRERITIADLPQENLRDTPRVLFKTNSWRDTTRFPDRIPVMERGLPTELKRRGVILIGVDVPSVDELDSKDLPIHHELGACGIQIVENLYLRDVPAGRYELIALPLKLAGADGAPVRALLRAPP